MNSSKRRRGQIVASMSFPTAASPHTAVGKIAARPAARTPSRAEKRDWIENGHTVQRGLQTKCIEMLCAIENRGSRKLKGEHERAPNGAEKKKRGRSYRRATNKMHRNALC